MFNRIRKTALGALLTTVLSFSIIGSFTVGNLATLSVITAVPIITAAPSCSKDQLAASANDVLDVVTDAAVIAALQTVAPGSVAKLAAIVPSARALVAAIKAGDFTTATASINAIFPIINLIAADLHANAQMLGIIALANIGLHFIINHVRASVPGNAASLPPEMQTAINYGSQPTWGCDYHKRDKRCH